MLAAYIANDVQRVSTAAIRVSVALGWVARDVNTLALCPWVLREAGIGGSSTGAQLEPSVRGEAQFSQAKVRRKMCHGFIR